MRLEAVKAPDQKWIEMKKVWDACEAANIQPPEEVLSFFNYTKPDAKGVICDLRIKRFDGICMEYQGENATGFELDINKFIQSPSLKGTTHIRFYCSY